MWGFSRMAAHDWPAWGDPLCILSEAGIWQPHLWGRILEEEARRSYPPMNLHVTETDNVMKLELPGRVHDGLELSAAGDLLVIKGRRRPHVKGKYLLRERFAGHFNRSIPVPGYVDPDGITARLSHGIVTITLPKRGEPEVTQIPVKSSR